MSYQERIYSQNGKCDRNFVSQVPTLSSDICVFNRPTFTMSGASSIDCPEVTCSISGVPYNDIFTGTTDCFTSYAITGTCFNSVDWITNVYEDDTLVYSNAFYTSTSLTGSVIDITMFSGSVVTAFDSLEYVYSFDNEEFTIDKVLDVKNIKLELTTELYSDDNCQVYGNYTGDTSCSCPSGFTATTGQDACEIITYTAATYNGSDVLAQSIVRLKAYSVGGALLYNDITNEKRPLRAIPVPPGPTGIEDADGVDIPFIGVVAGTQLWGQNTTSSGRLNNIGIWGNIVTPSVWVGFSSCIDIVESGQYVIGIGADDDMRFSLNGELIISFTNLSWGQSHQYWWMLPITLTSGKNIIEMQGLNKTGGFVDGGFGAEIYDAPIEVLSAMTTEVQLSAVTIFSTGELTGTTFEVGDLNSGVGYSCPSGYTVDACFTGATRCVSIDREAITCVFTGECSTNDVICDLDFSAMTLNSTNVYVLTGGTDTFDLSFEFTGNTESFDTTNALFKYEIYKYQPNLGYFENTPNFISETFDWSSISGTSAFTTSVTASTIDPDGQYLVKGQFIHDVCTEFGTLLNRKASTASITTGENYGIYQPTRDFYFVAFNEVDKPTLDISNTTPSSIGTLVVNSIILDGTRNTYNFPFTEGDYILSLNGLTLAPGYDYTKSVVEITGGSINTVVILGPIISGDVLTYAYAGGDELNSMKSDSFDIDSAIVSGTTDNEGSNTVYFNTTTGKYEIFLSMIPTNDNSIGITVNGVTLANNVDYYKSISNPKRIIFEGDLLVNDILVAYYNATTNIQGEQFGTSITVTWTIGNPPSSINGIFTVEMSNDEDFTTIITSATTPYVAGSIGYHTDIDLVGSFGDKQYYRVKNEKNFITLCNETLTTSAYSQIANITIQSNLNNSY